METQALDIIEEIYNMIAEAWGVPMGKDKCVIERDKVMGLLDELKACLPGELTEARRLMEAKTEFVNNTRREAENVLNTAKEEAARLISREEVVIEAKRQAEEIVATASKKSADVHRIVASHLDDTLRETEESIQAALEGIRQNRTKIRAAFAAEPEGTAEVTMQDVEELDFLDV